MANSDLNNTGTSFGLIDKDLGTEKLRRCFSKKLMPQSVLTKVLILDLDETLIHSTNVSEELSNKFEKLNAEDLHYR